MRNILLSFCIPIMGRLCDLQSTLRINLDDNRAQKENIEFIVICFDRGAETEDWINSHFAEDLSSGYLRFYRSDKLQTWHFGRAKNSFRGLAKGKVYASLDGDNFTGPAGGQHLIDVFKANDFNCIFHQFQGDWGDGTCGRISMPMQDYMEVGYNEEFLPRQWDELDAILSNIVRCPSRRYIHYKGKSIVDKSGPFRRFIEENEIVLQVVEIDSELDPLSKVNSSAAVGQNDSSYVQDDERLRLSSIFNHLSSFFINTRSDLLRNQYTTELVDTQRLMADRLDGSTLIDWFLAPQFEGTINLRSNDIVLTACLRNEVKLEAWLDYYRKLGVARFLLIDDDSEEPIAKRINSNDVHVWKPLCGKFRYSKAFWLELLLRNYAQGKWCITADGDEYLELPGLSNLVLTSQHRSPLEHLTEWASGNQVDYFPGVLLDMVPGSVALEELERGEAFGLEEFNHYQFRPATSSPAYLQHNTVKWSYGEYGVWASRVDVRFRLNRALDSLRKFPLFLMGPDIHLNQGFHDLIIAGEKRSSTEMARSDLLLIRHYKIYNTQNDIRLDSRPAAAYHQETKVNFERLKENYNRVLKNAIMSPFTYPFLDSQLIPVPGNERITICLSESGTLKEDAEKLLRRTAEIPLIISDVEPQFTKGSLKARSIFEAAAWIKKVTPFNVIESYDKNHVVLKISEAREEHQARSSSSYLTHNTLMGAFLE